MKTRTFILFLTVLALTLPAVGATIVSIQPPSQTQVQDGQTVSVTVDIAGVTDLYAFEFNLDYNDALLLPVSVTEGAFLPSGGATLFYDDPSTPGSIFILDTLESAVTGVSGSGPLASVQFLVLPGNGISPITYDSQVLLDSNFNDITSGATFNSGSISTPEPATYGVVGSALIGLAWILRRKVRR